MPSIGRITRRHSPGWAASLAPSYAPELNLCGSEVRGDEGIHRLHQRWFRFIERRKRHTVANVSPRPLWVVRRTRGARHIEDHIAVRIQAAAGARLQRVRMVLPIRKRGASTYQSVRSTTNSESSYRSILGGWVWYRGILYRQHMEPEETPNASHLVGIRFVQVHPGEDIRILLECLGGRRETDRHLTPAPISIYATLDDHLSRSTFRTSRSIGGDRSAPMTAYATVICCASKAT